MIITISGKPGSGKTTVGKLLAKKLGYQFVSMGDIRGEFAQKKGLTINELNAIGEKEDWTDKEIDKEIPVIAKKDNIVFDSYVAFHFVPDSLKIYFDVDPVEGAKRIVKDKRDDEKIGKTPEEHVPIMQEKIQSDYIRYNKWYNLDISDVSQYDLLIDTTEMSTEQVVEKIMKFISEFKA